MKTYTEPYNTTRIWEKTLRKLRLLRGLTGESVVEIIERLAEQELLRVKTQDAKDNQVQTVSDKKESAS